MGSDHVVVNLGEMLAGLTGGSLQATSHRVMNSDRADRITVPFFFNPSLNSQLESGRATRLSHNRIFRSYGHNALKSLFRSHPAVSKKWHSDLCVLGDGDVRNKDEKE